MKLTIPAQHSLPDPALEIQPRILHQWVEDLPYLNPLETARQCRDFLQRCNRQPLSAAQRLEALTPLAIPYWRLLDTLLSIPEPQIRDRQRQEETLLELQGYCQDLAFGYKIAVRDSQTPSGLFRRERPRRDAVLGAIRYLGQQLNHGYARYERQPAGLWLEVDQLYRHARKQGFHQDRHRDEREQQRSIEQCYLEITLLRIADPYRLPGGSLWEVLRCLQRHADRARLHPWEDELEAPGRHYLPAANPEAEGYRQGLCLDLTELAGTLQAILDDHTRCHESGFSERLEPGQHQRILRCLLEGWQPRVARKAERMELQADADLAMGLETAYCCLNGNRPFQRSAYLSGDEEEPWSIMPERERRSGTALSSLPCRTLNRSAGGISVQCNLTPAEAPGVGQLIAVRSRVKGSDQPGVWFVAAIRWLRMENRTGFELGAQYLGRDAVPVAVHILRGERSGHEYRPALRIELRQSGRDWHMLIGPKGLFGEGRLLELVENGRRTRVRAVRLMEAGIGFERFEFEAEIE